MANLRGNVTRVGRQILELGDNVTVNDIHQVEVDVPAEMEGDFQRDPLPLIKEFLEDQGHKVREIVGDTETVVAGHGGSSQAEMRPQGRWYHCVWDANDASCPSKWEYIV